MSSAEHARLSRVQSQSKQKRLFQLHLCLVSNSIIMSIEHTECVYSVRVLLC